jgi:hypothetical protein
MTTDIDYGAFDALICWGGVESAAFTNEMLDQRDQNAGTVSNHQSFSGIQTQYSGGWHNVSWALGRACDFNDEPTYWSCGVSSTNHNVFYNYDRRAP